MLAAQPEPLFLSPFTMFLEPMAVTSAQSSVSISVFLAPSQQEARRGEWILLGMWARPPDEILSPRKGISTELRAEDGAGTRLHANLSQRNQAESRPEAPS